MAKAVQLQYSIIRQCVVFRSVRARPSVASRVLKISFVGSGLGEERRGTEQVGQGSFSSEVAVCCVQRILSCRPYLEFGGVRGMYLDRRGL